MVSLVLLSHSLKLVEGIRDIIGEMAKGIPLFISGGNGTGGLGSDYAQIKDILHQAYRPEGTIILYDLGSTVMTAEVVMDELAQDMKSTIKISKAPLVEGSVVAAMEISGGAPLTDIMEALTEMELVK
ncbi:MAG: dihydroxyacetone kinase phosphoryl donor subunit DhaM [Defluviitaleaceae bacterium]|nr:dihydroxyacetone kinase phosphoryl donor subunit DhaM [Defluviitaleaceae bacterium]MCL2240231.1 dihydroxyacetone kinase phosphoryl donor subunit DhaM [Defluviitaleaceae bacterium]